MKILRTILFAILGIIILGISAFFILKTNPKPDLISLDRAEMSEAQIAEKAHELVGQMSLEEKVQMMSPILKSNLKFILEVVGDGVKYNQQAYQAGGNSRLNIPTMRFFDGPRGMVSGEATCFPVAMARAATFSPDLEFRVGEAIGREIRANQGNYFGGVCINLLRHPAGGRAQEAYGEDSYVLGQMGSALMQGVQTQNVMACIKHYALNNQENARFKINVEADERVLREVYLPHFKTCIDQGAASVMGAYNKFRGEHLCENEYILSTILKEDWGFQGFTISDFVFGTHDTQKAANAGLDVEMPSVEEYGDNLLAAVEAGEVSEDVITESALRMARTVLTFETRPDPVETYPSSLIGSQAHIDLALEAAEKSMVLMQNEQNALPLDADKISKVLVVGKLAVTENIGDHGSSRVHPAYVVTPMQGLERVYGDKVAFTHHMGDNLEEAARLAQEADAVIFVVGYDHDDEGEFIEGFGGPTVGGDRASLRLHEEESQLLQAVGEVNPNSVAVLIGGSAILVEEWKDKVKAIIHAFYPGMEGGTAIAKIIFGAVNPGGKLPFTVAHDEAHYPEFDRFADEVTYDRYHGYIKLDQDGNEASFPFGFGLSYTTFEQNNEAMMLTSDSIKVSTLITNTGSRTGDEVVQLYIGFDNSQVEREHKLLKAFQRITLAAGESKEVTLSVPLKNLRWYNPELKAWELENMTYQVYIGTSSNEKDLVKLTFEIGEEE